MRRGNTTEVQDVLPIAWFEQGLNILHAKKIDEVVYQNKTIKERLFDSMAASFILALLENAESRGLTRDEALAAPPLGSQHRQSLAEKRSAATREDLLRVAGRWSASGHRRS